MIVASIIIINFNTAPLTIQAIKSIEKHVISLENFEIIIVDNSSENSDYLELKNSIDKIKNLNLTLLKSKFNLGFGGGNTLGVQYANSEYYVFMNSDVILKEDCITTMIEFLNKNKHTSIVGCQAVNENNEKFKGFDYGLSLKSEIFSNSLLQFINKKKYPSRIVNSNEPMVVDAVAGSLFTCVATDFVKIGGFDTNMFLYYEEKDLAFRVKNYLKKQVVLIPKAQYIHLKGKSTKTSQSLYNELKISQFYSIQKNLGFIKYSFFYILHLFIFLIKSPFSKKNRGYLFLLLSGISTAKSIKNKQIKL
ncbi:glycosyltransferase family 2 protein [Flavobacterium degerlachei]|jgi:hypothetical protein|uniref:Glycosyltransferase 2-like domain-containing protein n=1 Tax=Flavobacterium degerlachei TaxID=229203 RepID=A0A1H3GSW4_9FLAO|nr:glycosyltransferase family 2 protein [Flavobacterium degerlachei]SDY06371.1 hypothetical protein SAMN05444338_12712 [Flavobacterium degerlachei]